MDHPQDSQSGTCVSLKAFVCVCVWKYLHGFNADFEKRNSLCSIKTHTFLILSYFQRKPRQRAKLYNVLKADLESQGKELVVLEFDIYL